MWSEGLITLSESRENAYLTSPLNSIAAAKNPNIKATAK
jgi:hypothetical protein